MVSCEAYLSTRWTPRFHQSRTRIQSYSTLRSATESRYAASADELFLRWLTECSAYRLHDLIFIMRAQALGDRIVFPSAFNRSYRCVVKNIKSYVMEELANLIFIGCYIAQCGPPAFKSLWTVLQPAMWHYLYGVDDTDSEQKAAANAMRKYAQKLEKLVAERTVRSHLQAYCAFVYECAQCGCQYMLVPSLGYRNIVAAMLGMHWAFRYPTICCHPTSIVPSAAFRGKRLPVVTRPESQSCGWSDGCS